jgi:hypothetical protein
MLRRSLATLGAAAMAAGLVSVATATSASAGAYGCAGSLVWSHALKNGNNITQSNLYLYYNSSTGYNCAVNVWASTAGTKSWITVGILSSTDGAWNDDPGPYQSYAGPVMTYGANRCIKVYGYTSNSTTSISYTSGWVACG